MMHPRFTVVLRQPTPAEAELAITQNGATAVYPLNIDQIKLLAIQSVSALVGWSEHRPLSKLDMRDDIQKDVDEEREQGWAVS
jgi:hypothetical protein